jgi:hypothetical protein
MGAHSLVSIADNRWDEKAGLQRDALSSQVIDALRARETRRLAMKKLTTTMMQETLNKQDGRLTVGLDLGDRSSFYCVLDEAGEVLLEQKVSTTPKAIKEIFRAIPRSRIALQMHISKEGDNGSAKYAQTQYPLQGVARDTRKKYHFCITLAGRCFRCLLVGMSKTRVFIGFLW